MSQARDKRLNALLDMGLANASADDAAWLAEQRAVDAGFDAEVRALLALETQLVAWGEAAGGSACGSAAGTPSGTTSGDAGGEAVEALLDGIWAGVDAGQYDDGEDFAAFAPSVAERESAATAERAPAALSAPISAPISLAARREARAQEKQGTESHQAARSEKASRSEKVARWTQVLAAAAAVVLVVTAGLSAVRLSSPDDTSENAAPTATAPAFAPAAAPAGAAAEQAPLAIGGEREPRAEFGQAQDDSDAPPEPENDQHDLDHEALQGWVLTDAPEAPTRAQGRAGVVAATGSQPSQVRPESEASEGAGGASLRGTGGAPSRREAQDPIDDLLSAPMVTQAPRSRTSAAGAARSPGAVDPNASSAMRAGLPPAEDTAADYASAQRRAPAPAPAAPAAAGRGAMAVVRDEVYQDEHLEALAEEAEPSAPLTSRAALTRAWQRCVQAPHALTYEVVPGSGQVRNLRAAGASPAELACLRRVASRAALAPAPRAVLRERLTLGPAGQ